MVLVERIKNNVNIKVSLMSKKSTIAIGVDFGTESVKAVALEFFSGEPIPRVLGVGGALSQGVKRGAIINPEEAGEALREAVLALASSCGVAKENIYVGIGGLAIGFQKSKGLIAISRADGEVSKEDMKRAVLASETNLSKMQNREVLHRIPLFYKVDNETPTQDPSGLSGVKLEAETFFITSQSTLIKSTIKSFENADLEVEEIIASSLACQRAVLQKRELEVGVMVMDIGASTTSIAIFEEGLPYSLEVLPVGSGHITQDIAVGFQVPLDEAEKMKLDFNPNSSNKANGKKKLSDIIELRFEDIFELVEKHLKKVERIGLLPAGIVIVGGGANFPGIEELVKNYLKLPARVGFPHDLLGEKDKIKNPAWSTAVGIAIHGLEGSKNSFMRGKPGSFLRWLRTFLP